MINFNPTSLNFYYSGTELAAQNIRCLLNLSDILNNPRYTVSVSYNQSQMDWLRIFDNLETDITDKEQFGYPLNLKIKHDHNVIIPDGNYSANVWVQFSGESSGDLQYPTPYDDFGTFQVYLSVNAGISGFSVSPNFANFHIAKNLSLNPTQDLVFTSPAAFTISGSDKFLVNGNPLPYNVSANSTVTLSVNNTIRQLQNGVYDYLLQLKNGNYNYGQLPVKVVLTNTNDLEIFPSELKFKGIKGISEPAWQNLYIYDPVGDAVIEIPDFIRHEFVSNDNGFKIYSIKPKESNSLKPGDYSGEITFTSGNKIVKTNVYYTLDGLYNANYERNYHFTLDSEKLVLAKAIEDQTTFLRLSLNLKFYDFKGVETKIDNRELDFFFYNSRVEFDPGELIHEMFDHYNNSANERFNELNVSTGLVPQYQFASIYFEVSEIEFTTLEVKNSYVIPTQFYVKGRRPEVNLDNCILTQRSGHFTRITTNSLISFNFIKYDSGNLILKKNDVAIDLPIDSPGDEIPQGSDVRIFGGIIKVSDIKNVKENDILELSFGAQKLYYNVEEPGINSINVFYKNQWNLLSSYELTGEFIIESEYERITTTNFKNWVETTKTLYSSKKQNIKITTGFIPRENTRIIAEILDSQKAFLVINNFTYEVRCISTKLTNQNTKKNLVDHELQFELKNITNDSFYIF